MGFFQKVEGEAAVLVNNGVYQQVDVYVRDSILYGKVGSGFVKLYADGSTTKAKMRLDALSWDGVLCKTPLGVLTGHVGDGNRLLDAPVRAKLLGLPAPNA